jgi:multiple sugar transport system substrate-binding protein
VNVGDYYDIPEITTFREKRFGFIYRALVFGWWLNRSLFESKGVPLPGESWSYDDMVESAKRLTDVSNPDLPVYGVELRPLWNIFPLYRAAGVEYLNREFSRNTWDSAASVSLLQWLLDVVHRHRAAPTPQTATDKQLAYDKGNVAMREGLTGSKATQRSIGDRIRWENAWPPRWKATGKRSLLVDGNAWHVTGKSEQAGLTSEVADLILLFLGPEVQEQNLVHEGFGMPIPKKLAIDPRFTGPPPDSLRLVPEMWKDGKTYDRIVGGREWLGALTPLLADAMNGKMAAGELARQMTDAGNAVLSRVTVPAWGRG